MMLKYEYKILFMNAEVKGSYLNLKDSKGRLRTEHYWLMSILLFHAPSMACLIL